MHLSEDEPFQRVSQYIGMIRIYFAVQFIGFSIPYYFLWFTSNCFGRGRVEGLFVRFCAFFALNIYVRALQKFTVLDSE